MKVHYIDFLLNDVGKLLLKHAHTNIHTDFIFNWDVTVSIFPATGTCSCFSTQTQTHTRTNLKSISVFVCQSLGKEKITLFRYVYRVLESRLFVC